MTLIYEPKVDILGQGCQKLEVKQDSHTDATENINGLNRSETSVGQYKAISRHEQSQQNCSLSSTANQTISQQKGISNQSE